MPLIIRSIATSNANNGLLQCGSGDAAEFLLCFGGLADALVGGLSQVFGLLAQQVERTFLRRHQFLERDALRFRHISSLLFQLLELLGCSLVLANTLFDLVCGVLNLQKKSLLCSQRSCASRKYVCAISI